MLVFKKRGKSARFYVVLSRSVGYLFSFLLIGIAIDIFRFIKTSEFAAFSGLSTVIIFFLPGALILSFLKYRRITDVYGGFIIGTSILFYSIFGYIYVGYIGLIGP